MKAIVLGAGHAARIGAGATLPKCLLEGLAGWRVLDWLLNALGEGASVDDVVFVGGDEMERIQSAYPHLRYVHNPRWADEHVVGSLFAARDELDSAFYFTYADIVYRPDVVHRLRQAAGDVVVVVDRAWRTRYAGRNEAQLRDAEKVVLRDGKVTWIGKDLPLDQQIHGEFIGLARFSERGAAWLRQTYDELAPHYLHHSYRNRRHLHAANLTDLLQEMVEQGLTVNAVEIDGDYAELDAPSDLHRFVFGTKAETLERLRPMLTRARVTEGLHVRVGEWMANPQAVALELVHRFGGDSLAIRSSAVAEDTITESAAGRYHSVIGVDGQDVDAIATAVQEVVASYEVIGANPDDQILVQPCLTGVSMSGVMMTRDLDSGAEYLVLHYDETSGRTDRVTAGNAGPTTTVRVHRGTSERPDDPRLAALVETAEELESITGSDALDVEFAFTEDGTLHVLQVRPIARRAAWTSVDPDAHAAEIDAMMGFVGDRLGPNEGVAGACTVLGQMPDWNPAEMIGPFPAPFALSLYELLITDDTWREARADLGYADVFPHALMVNLAGRPFVDVRLSANSLLPASMPFELRENLVDAAIARLREHPELHDKVEFDVLPTAWHFDLSQQLDVLVGDGLPVEDLSLVRAHLLEHTSRLVSAPLVEEWLARTEALDARVDRALGGDGDPIERARELLAWTKREGTLPFAALARLAFVGTSLLRSLQAVGAIDAAALRDFIAGTRTVTTELVEALGDVRDERLSLDFFLERFGHLRPGTYDLLSRRYDQDPGMYFGAFESEGHALPVKHAHGGFDTHQRARIDAVVATSGLGRTTEELLSFARAAIAARELAKFRFTRASSAAMELLAEFGATQGLTREDLMHLDVKKLLEMTRDGRIPQLAEDLRRTVTTSRLRRQRQEKILLPGLISSTRDLVFVRSVDSRPNFVTTGRVRAPLVRLSASSETDRVIDNADLAGRIVLVEGADPGYDWIFTHGIAGLVTRYGGANSHMTIRCAEFGLPAAIGCGDTLYEELARATAVELDCSAEVLRVVA